MEHKDVNGAKGVIGEKSGSSRKSGNDRDGVNKTGRGNDISEELEPWPHPSQDSWISRGFQESQGIESAMQHKDKVRIQQMFSRIAQGYDRANTFLSLGIHHLWKKKLVALSGAQQGDRILDCATGTGDLAFALARIVGDRGSVIGIDFCEEMLEKARLKQKKMEDRINSGKSWRAERRISGGPITFQWADAMALPFPDHFFDVTTISFGLRNVEDPLVALREMLRVTRPGGRVCILDFGQVKIPIFHFLYNVYSSWVLPHLGGWITGQPSAYVYLQKSSLQFPCREDFINLLFQKASDRFSDCQWKSLSGGIAYVYTSMVKK